MQSETEEKLEKYGLKKKIWFNKINKTKNPNRNN